MNFINLIEKNVNELSTKKRIALIDGDDKRAIEAAKILKKYSNIEVILLVEKDKDVLKDEKLNFYNINSLDNKQNEFTNQYFEARENAAKKKNRENKETKTICQSLMKTRPFYAMMMLKNNYVDGVVGGLNYSTADILRAAFKVIGPKKGIKTISSVMVMHKNEKTYFFSDISVNPKPDQSMLVDIALNASEFVKSFKIEPYVAFLSFSTNYSAKTPDTELVHNATIEFNSKNKELQAIGEVQLDAALDLEVRKSKYNLPSFNKEANVLIFPDLNAGNIGYKLVQRMANYGAIGPIIVGTAKPINDLSRGSKVDDVVNTVLITSLQS